MLTRQILFPIGILAATVLCGCGGGSGSASGNDSPAAVSLSGNAAKGVLIGADVKAYEIINGLKSTSVWASTTTDSSGAYNLKSMPTKNPVVVEVIANSQTTMLDETKIEADGSFAKVWAPSNLTLRSFVASMSEAANVQVNPITEAAMVIANASVGTDKKLTLDTLTAAKQVALQMAPAGTNPFSEKPALKATDMSAEQSKLSAMMAGLIKSADSTCDLKCQIGMLSKDIKIDVGADGKGTLTSAAALAIQTRRTDLLTQGKKAWLDDSTNSSRLGNKLADVKVATLSALSASKTSAVPTTTPSYSEASAAEGLEGFITALRDGFRATEKNLQTAQDELNNKYQTLSLVGSQDTMDAIDRVKRDCFEGKTTFACTNASDSNVTWTANGDTWTGKATNSDGNKWEGTVSGSLVSGTVNATLNATKKSSTGKLLTKIENLSVMAHEDSTTESGNFNVNGIIRAAAQNSDLVVSLTAKDWKGTMSKTTDTPQKGTLSGEVILSVSNGDMLQGSIKASGDKRTITRNYCAPYGTCNYTQHDVSFTDMELHLTAINNNSQLLKLDVIGTQVERDNNKVESASNFTKFNAEASVVLTDSLTLKINGSQSEWSTENYTATITSGGSEVKVSTTLTIDAAVGGNIAKNKWCTGDDLRCTKQLNLTSAGNLYTATLMRSNGKAQGDIYKGATKVGIIQNGLIQINGRDVSIY